MITAMKLTGAPQALAIYHSGEENYYYKQGVENVTGEAPEYVKVYGNLCKDLGLKPGQSIDELTFTNLLQGRDAEGVQRTRVHKVHGIDLTFSAPKTVSIAGLLTDKNPAITEAHDTAVIETMREIEAVHSFARPTSTTKISTGKMVYVTVRDGLSREQDPHLHTHAIVMNITKGPKSTDKIMGLWSREILAVEFNKVWGAVYRAKLAGKLQELGYSISYTKQGMWRLDKVNQEMEKEFSQRHMDIARAKAKGKLDMQAWRTTRADKKPESYAKVIKYNWENRASYIPQRGTERNKYHAVIDRAAWSTKAIWSLEAQQERSTARGSTTEAQKWQLAVRRATQNTATVSHKELITEYLTELARSQKWKPITYAECESRLTEQIKQGNLIQTQEERITSWEMLTADRQAVETIRDTNDERRTTILSEHEANRGLNNYQNEQELRGRKKLSDVQKQAVKSILIQTKPVTIVQGDAGSGKTTALRAVNEICREKSIPVIGLAMQGIAARNLEAESGIKSQTLASYLSQSSSPNTHDQIPNTVVIVDEASMLDSRNTAKLLEKVKSNNDRLILVGDKNQLESIGAGRPFDRLVEQAERDNNLISLCENYRQKDQILREAVDLARNGRMTESLELLDRTENIKEISNDTERRQEVAKQYSLETLIITGTVQAREELNNQIRANLISKEQLNDKNGMTYRMDIPNPEGLSEHKRLQLTKGDKITFLMNEYRDYDIRNGERATVMTLNDKNIEVLTADGRNLNIDINKYRAIDYGYALTTYKAQGQTYNKVIVEADTKIPSLNDMRNQYVQITRARDKVTIYTDDKESLKELADLKTHSRDTLDENITLQQAEKNKQQMEKRVGEYIQDSMKSFKETPLSNRLPERKQGIEPIRDITIHNEKSLDHLIPDKWTYNYIQDKMNQTTKRLRERRDLTYKQKEAIARLLNTDDGEYIWTKKSLSPDGRIATAQLLLGERDREQILENISKPEIGVIKEVERHHAQSKSRGRERGRERGLER